MTEAQIEALAHRMCWRYKHSTDPAHSHTYLFNRHTLLDFVRAVLEGEPHSQEAQEVHKALDSRGVPRRSLTGLEYTLWGRLMQLLSVERGEGLPHVAQVWHEGSQSFYDALLLRKLPDAEVSGHRS